MRIITGKARGVRLQTLEGETTRPTAERVKEAVFSMLQFEIEDRQVLDLYAGSGQLGLEAVSRGAARAVLVDRSKDAVEIIKKNALKTKLALDCEIYCADAVEFLRSCRGKRCFDLVFLDPPYAKDSVPRAIRELIRYRAIGEGCTLVCETEDAAHVFDGDAELESRFTCLRSARYGIAHITLLRMKGEDA